MKTEAYHDEFSHIRDNADTLRGIYKALRRIGLNELSVEIAGLSSELNASAKRLEDLLSKDLSEQLHDAQAHTGAMLGAVITGCELDKRRTDINQNLLESLKECFSIVALQNGNLHDDTNAIQAKARAAIAEAEASQP